jgi:uncharacterized Ntn-hydrolase superfamily protein
VATFSIVARDPETGDLGVAVQSRFLGVGSVVPWARADVGAIATQAWANTTFGPEGLRLLAAGRPAAEVLKTLVAGDDGSAWRQLGIVDAKGRAASFTGEKALDWAGHRTGDGFACQGNILAGEEVVEAMAKAFRESEEPLPERLVAALRAGQAAGGDRRGRQSAALLVVRAGGGYSGFNDRYVDLRVEDHERPIEELARVLALHRKTFGIPPLPAELRGFAPEPEDAKDGPRAAWARWVALFRADDLEALHALHARAFREANPLEEWAASVRKNRAGYESFLERVTYAGTRIEGETARIALRGRGAPRPTVLRLVREDGVWRFAE